MYLISSRERLTPRLEIARKSNNFRKRKDKTLGNSQFLKKLISEKRMNNQIPINSARSRSSKKIKLNLKTNNLIPRQVNLVRKSKNENVFFGAENRDSRHNKMLKE